MRSLAVVILTAGVPDQNGSVYSREALEVMAAESDELSLDKEGRLWRNFQDSQTQEFADYLEKSGASPEMAGNFALENFADVLKERQRRGLPGCYPKIEEDSRPPSGCSTESHSPSGCSRAPSGWIPLQKVEEEEE